jgi:enoyl-CoA hydratase/carnithine racemase
MLVFAERMDSGAALASGLVSEVCAPGNTRDRALEIGHEYASKITSESVALLKDLIHNAYGSSDRATASLAAISDRLLLSTEESQDAMKAASGSGSGANTKDQ